MRLAIASVAIFAGALFSGCSDAGQPIVSQNTPNANTGLTTRPAERPETAIAHSSAAEKGGGGGMSRWTQSGDPIDTSKYDAEIASAEKDLKSAPNGTGAKKALAEAYLKRAIALTEARQYASALGDYRRTLKHDPDNAEAKNWIQQITSIYASINRSSPAEGEEPPPLPYNKPKS
jgi:tetratricopeptide (TPR) repeat protein